MGKYKPEIRRNAYKSLELRLIRVIEVEVKINVPDRIFRILKESGKLHLIEEWALDGIEARLETFTAADLVDP